MPFRVEVMQEITWEQASARRLERHHLTDGARLDDPALISADVLGVHAQVMSAAVLSIGIRGATLGADDVRTALWTTGMLVKSRGPRGTVHLLAATDLPMWTGALSALPKRSSPFPPDARMSERQTEEVVAAIDDAVQGAELTVDELTDANRRRYFPSGRQAGVDRRPGRKRSGAAGQWRCGRGVVPAPVGTAYLHHCAAAGG